MVHSLLRFLNRVPALLGSIVGKKKGGEEGGVGGLQGSFNDFLSQVL